MSGATHTPGPWVICVNDDNPESAETVFAASQLVNGCIEAGAWDDFVVRAGLNHGNFEANARLIAAAPELLKALQAMLEQLSRGPFAFKNSGALCFARAAVKKATGETP